MLYQAGCDAAYSDEGQEEHTHSGARCHDLLRFYGQMRKGRGMCIASAIVVDGDDKRVIQYSESSPLAFISGRG